MNETGAAGKRGNRPRTADRLLAGVEERSASAGHGSPAANQARQAPDL